MTQLQIAPPPSSTTQISGSVPSQGLAPLGNQSYDFPTWKSTVTQAMADNIAHNTGAGYPGGWDYGRLGTWETDIGKGGVSAGTLAKIGSYLDSYQPGQSSWIDQNFGMPPPRTANDYVVPEDLWLDQQRVALQGRAQALDERQQSFTEFKWAAEKSLSQQVVRSLASGGSASGSGGGGGSSATDYASRLAYERASAQIDLDYLQNKISLEDAQDAALTAYERAQIELSREQIEENRRQFDLGYGLDQAQLGLQERALGLDRAKTISALGANPGDAVARELYLRGAPQATGTPVDIFTGQQGAPTTFSALQESQKDIFAPYVQPGNTSVPPPPAPENIAPLDPNAAPPPPAYNQGGYTTEPMMRVGDSGPSMNRTEELVFNPTRAPLAIMDNEQSRAAMAGRAPMPRFATGTQTWTSESQVPQGLFRVADSYYSGVDSAQYQSLLNRMSPEMALQQSGAQLVGTLDQQAVLDDYFWAGGAGAAAINSPYADATGQEYSPAPPPNPAIPTAGQTGYLTPAQIDNGDTQSVNPQAPNYVPPEGFPTGTPAGYEAPPAPTGPATIGEMQAWGVANGVPTTNLSTLQAAFIAANPTRTTDAARAVAEEQTPAEAAGSSAPPPPQSTLPGAYTPKPGEPITDFNTRVAGSGTTPVGGTDGTTSAPPPVNVTPPNPDGTPALGQANSGGYTPVLSAGTVKTADGGGSYTLIGDGSEWKGPDGNYYAYNPATGKYQVLYPAPTIIANRNQWLALAPEVRSQILSGKPTGFYIDNATGWANAELVSGAPPPQNSPQLTVEQFRALSPEQQRALIEGTGATGTPGIGYYDTAGGGSNLSTPAPGANYGGIDTRFVYQQPDYQFQRYNYDTPEYVTPDLAALLYPEFWNTSTPTVPPLTTNAPAGPQAGSGETSTPAPQPGGDGVLSTSPPPPPSGSAPPPQGTTAPPPATGTAPPPAAGGNPSVLSYGPEVWQSILANLFGNAESVPVGNQNETTVPALGVTLPSLNSLNVGSLLDIYAKGGGPLLEALFAAGNRDLPTETAIAKLRAPSGSAVSPTLVQTGV